MKKLVILGLFSPLLSAVVAAPAPVPSGRGERRAQEAAAALVVRLGGTVFYGYQQMKSVKPNAFDPKAKPKDPKAFHRVVCVGLRGSKVADKDLGVIARLPGLVILDVSRTGVTNGGLAYLKGVKSLRVLSSNGTRVDDAGLEHIEGLTRMWLLLLDDTKVSNAGLVHLGGFTGMEEWLGSSGTRVTDGSIEHLQGFTTVRHLDLSLTKVTAQGRKDLRGAVPNTHISVDPRTLGRAGSTRGQLIEASGCRSQSCEQGCGSRHSLKGRFSPKSTSFSLAFSPSSCS